ncbi:hypothetical protein ASE04_21225 [Rhizobium sp. Root708]|uniref:hypothetical protein n=1 Tax=Rhizobium sp. Root708 TaxID=1736592 RepID=UPI000701644C|nr:hypothetical protein [Rhizobium sp. Root708]KRB61390.1 hypothetical protein ASE04_21225 [Rhizobium sp. Root708]
MKSKPEAIEIINAPDHISESTCSALLGLQDRLGKVCALITLVDYALMAMSEDDDGSINALQAGMSEIHEQVITVSMKIAEIRAAD